MVCVLHVARVFRDDQRALRDHRRGLLARQARVGGGEQHPQRGPRHGVCPRYAGVASAQGLAERPGAHGPPGRVRCHRHACHAWRTRVLAHRCVRRQEVRLAAHVRVLQHLRGTDIVGGWQGRRAEAQAARVHGQLRREDLWNEGSGHPEAHALHRQGAAPLAREAGDVRAEAQTSAAPQSGEARPGRWDQRLPGRLPVARGQLGLAAGGGEVVFAATEARKHREARRRCGQGCAPGRDSGAGRNEEVRGVSRMRGRPRDP
mmetsp:Transcript_109620/g.315635  ORF Transcript_109620/g.315635 Transcript_109620/m.315635 type:complete len:261 (-) Transcript_109620:36-818(-)